MTAARRLGRDVRRVTAADLPDVLAFQAHHYGAGARQTEAATVAWRGTRHPLRAPEIPEMWLCHRNEAVVGVQAGLPFELEAGGQRLRSLWAIDLMVAPEWRLRGVAPALLAALTGSRPVTVALGVAEAAQKAMRRAGWQDLGDAPRWWRLLRPLPPSVGGKARALSRLAAPAMTAADRLALPPLIAATGVACVRLERFDARADAIWEACRRDYAVMARRDGAALRWRFDDAPGAAAYRRYLLLRGGRPLGYFVLRESVEARRGLHRALLVDFLCPRRWQAVLLAHAVVAARRTGAVVLQCLCPAPAAGRALAATGFARRPGQRLMVHIRPDAEESFAHLRDPSRWFVTFADSDLDHLPVPEEGGYFTATSPRPAAASTDAGDD